MKFCRFCGKQISEDSLFCPGCGKSQAAAQPAAEATPQTDKGAAAKGNLDELKNKVTPFLKKTVFLILLGAIAVVAAICLVLNVNNCSYSGCDNKPVSGSSYCYTHKCAVDSCNSSHSSYSNYCYSHSKLYDEDSKTNGSYVSSSDLVISSPSITSGYSYTYAEGTIKNNGNSTVEYVKIKGAFTDSSGNVIDTDWTYAVGSEGLAPGESCKWKMSVEKDYRISKCKVSIMDFDY